MQPEPPASTPFTIEGLVAHWGLDAQGSQKSQVARESEELTGRLSWKRPNALILLKLEEDLVGLGVFKKFDV